MAGAKIAIRGKSNTSEVLPDEERWTVVADENGAFPGRAIYLESFEGIGRKDAENLASRLRNARAVPRASLDHCSRYDPQLHKAWEERHSE